MSRFFLDELRSKAPIKKCNAPLQRQKIVWLAATFLCVAPLSWKIGPPLPHCWYVCQVVYMYLFINANKVQSLWNGSVCFISLNSSHLHTTQQFQAITATTEWNSNADGFVLRTFNDRRVVLKKIIYILNYSCPARLRSKN